jgi:NAD(P)-dependent dehydrogenase (short-subunit alcohol dehydrogenase family)
MIDFKEQVVIVTGAGRGLGRLFALDFARRGAAVVVNDLGGTTRGGGSDSRVADEVVEEIRRAGGTAVASYDSVASPEGGAAIVRTAIDNFGRLDAVVSNAGILDQTPFDKLTVEQWRTMLTVHLDGSFYLSQPAFKVMKAQGYGRFVLISSSAGMFGSPNQAHYGAAKGGIFGLSNIIALEGAAHGILANCVLPSGASRMFAQATSREDEVKAASWMKLLDPDLVVPMVVFLASGACTVTHQNYSAAAGRYARVFAGVGPGWLSEAGSKPVAEDIEAHFAEVSATTPFYVPSHSGDEVAEYAALRGVSFSAPGGRK